MEKIYTCGIFRKRQKCRFPQTCGRVEGLILDGLPRFTRIPKRKTNQKFLKYVTRLGFKPQPPALQVDILTT